MASLGHVVVGMAAARSWPTPPQESHSDGVPRASPWRLVATMALLALLSLMPDADVIAFKFGIPYESPFGIEGRRTPSPSHSFAVSQRLASLG